LPRHNAKVKMTSVWALSGDGALSGVLRIWTVNTDEINATNDSAAASGAAAVTTGASQDGEDGAKRMEPYSGNFQDTVVGGRVSALCHLPSLGRLAVAVSSPTEGTVSISIWEVNTEVKLHTEFRGHTKWISSLCYVQQEQLLISGSYDKTLRIWDVWTGQAICEMWDLYRLSSVCCDEGAHLIYAGSHNTTVKCWEYQSYRSRGDIGLTLLCCFKGHKSSVSAICVNTNLSQVISATTTGELICWDARNNCNELYSIVTSSRISSLSFVSNRNLIVVTLPDLPFRVSFRDSANGNVLVEYRACCLTFDSLGTVYVRADEASLTLVPYDGKECSVEMGNIVRHICYISEETILM
jgi:WD40 repeat protein